MTLHLALVRHAKSSWSDPLLGDHQRPLNKRGRRSAEAIGTWLAGRDWAPDEVLCSTATRTRQTHEIIAGVLRQTGRVRYLDSLYHASGDRIVSLLRSCQGPKVMLVGHNPGISEAAEDLVRTPPDHPDFFRYPTAATTLFRFEKADWTGIDRNCGKIVDFVVPRELLK